MFGPTLARVEAVHLPHNLIYDPAALGKPLQLPTLCHAVSANALASPEPPRYAKSSLEQKFSDDATRPESGKRQASRSDERVFLESTRGSVVWVECHHLGMFDAPA